MIPLIITTLTSLVAGVLIGGCSRSDDQIAQSLLDRNSQLENQVSTNHDALTALAVTAIILSAGLGVTLFKHLKGGRIAPKERPKA